jgi:hypothetical protein
MTPKEKAEELVDKFMNTFYRTQDFIWKSTAKQCALIAIDEILKAAFYATDEIYNYYLEVKQEIEKL